LNLEAAVARVTGILNEEGIPYMVIGGVANLLWGVARTTTDLDVTVDVEAVGTESFLPVAHRCGLPLLADPAVFAEERRVLPIRTADGTRVDFILATLPFEFEAIRRSSTATMAHTEFRVCTAEDLIILKAASERPRDHDDVVGVLRRQKDRLDLARLDSVVEGLATDLAEPEIATRYREAKRAAGLR
jgi:predicted nucleotidyltransferase